MLADVVQFREDRHNSKIRTTIESDDDAFDGDNNEGNQQAVS